MTITVALNGTNKISRHTANTGGPIALPIHPPILIAPLTDQAVQYDTLGWNYSVSTSFKDVDSLSFKATLANGDPLPAWIHIATTTGLISGSPGFNDRGTYALNITAFDTESSSISTPLTVAVTAFDAGRLFVSTHGNDNLIGNLPNDTVTYAYAIAPVTVSLAIAPRQNTGGAGSDILTHIENLIGGSNNDSLTGNAQNNVLDGNAGADTLKGGAGNDTYIVDNPGDIITENFNAGIDKIISSTTYTLKTNVENLTLIGTLAINGTGNGLANSITGNAANNILNGGIGADTLAGGAGNDTYIVDNISDIVSETINAGIDKVNSSVTYTLLDNVENLTLTGTLPIDGKGNSSANIIVGNAAINKINGGTGADTLRGGLGDDAYFVDNAGDVIIENLNEGIDRVNSFVSYTLPSNVENLILASISAINATGNDLNNLIIGNTADNLLSGGAGNDILNGGSGNNTLTGGSGKDYFQFKAAGHLDTIIDFNVVDDTIKLDKTVFTVFTNPVPSPIDATTFIIGAQALDANDFVIYNSAIGALLYDADGSGSAGAVQFATVTPGLVMTNNDFHVI